MKKFSICSVEGCGSWSKAKGFCGKHYMRNWTHGDVSIDNRATGGTTCIVPDCGIRAFSGGLCPKHYQRNYRHGNTDSLIPAYGTGVSDSHGLGYIKTWDGKINQYEHIRIAEKALGKPLPKGAEVHHVDGNPANNDPSNLVICPDRAYHKLLHKLARARDNRERVEKFLESISR